MDRITVPKGKYYLGDPCYSFQGNSWGKVLDESNCFELPYVRGRKMAIAFGTGGDGEYKDQFGNKYPVDAGLIGLVHHGLKEGKCDGARLVEFKTPVECFQEGEVLHFGEFQIDLNPEVECCEECGREM